MKRTSLSVVLWLLLSFAWTGLAQGGYKLSWFMLTAAPSPTARPTASPTGAAALSRR